ncbi:DNA alkylation repair protein [Hoyosella rhizosphaerae]|uniref:DNA alkylation repair protein n=1 Tax=Hoyosella rhizosphaerae TaxID=1755582 RepID=A0A916XDD1_9ACTN|nr:DNA alkylation repair protein [Hoyosella rhizosphaerae]MBN4927555.1 DNA alkylation repair protein [Hoyosella rhizosphaerae]GGC63538.1 hypothetical protein GCM10011410_15000 [Hoyosella rhizosphaerae]
MPTADELISPSTVRDLAGCVQRTVRSDARALLDCAASLDGLRFGDRVRAVRDAFLADVPGGFDELQATLRLALRDDRFTGWMIFPVTEAVAARGLGEFEPALALLAELTPRLTAETAVRPFIMADSTRALTVIEKWVRHPDEHVRRLASEGTRPRLPWAQQIKALIADPSPALPILHALHRDSSEYVRRSVANHLNDISRDHPGVAVAVAREWMDDPDANTVRVVRHGLRTLVKAGDRDALGVLGFSANAQMSVTVPELENPLVNLGAALEFRCTVTNYGEAAADVAVDYVIHHVRANGSRTPKVFKLGVRQLEPGAQWCITKRHAIKPITTRRYYSGEHLLEVQVNGVRSAAVPFILTTP